MKRKRKKRISMMPRGAMVSYMPLDHCATVTDYINQEIFLVVMKVTYYVV